MFWIPSFDGMTTLINSSKVVTPVKTGVQYFCNTLKTRGRCAANGSFVLLIGGYMRGHRGKLLYRSDF
jgi:hypothetical protein